jgi:hypothetical protein
MLQSKTHTKIKFARTKGRVKKLAATLTLRLQPKSSPFSH